MAEELHRSLERKDTPDIWRNLISILGGRYLARAALGWYAGQSKENAQQAKNLEPMVDTFTGALSAYAVGGHIGAVKDQIKVILSETVALEKGKDSKDIGWWDLYRSKNPLVKETLSNFFKFNALRVLVTSSFFLRPLALFLEDKAEHLPGFLQAPVKWYSDAFKSVNSMEAGMGITSFLYVYELNKPGGDTIFERSQKYVVPKLNPAHTVTLQASPDDLYYIHQEFASKHAKEQLIKPDENNGMNRHDRFRILFKRLADVVSASYGGEAGKKGEMTYSLFLYLVGFKKLDPDNIEKALLYTEVSFRDGINGVKQVDAMFKRGMNEKQIASELGVNINFYDYREKYGRTEKALAVPSGTPDKPYKVKAGQGVDKLGQASVEGYKDQAVNLSRAAFCPDLHPAVA